MFRIHPGRLFFPELFARRMRDLRFRLLAAAIPLAILAAPIAAADLAAVEFAIHGKSVTLEDFVGRPPPPRSTDDDGNLLAYAGLPLADVFAVLGIESDGACLRTPANVELCEDEGLVVFVNGSQTPLAVVLQEPTRAGQSILFAQEGELFGPNPYRQLALIEGIAFSLVGLGVLACAIYLRKARRASAYGAGGALLLVSGILGLLASATVLGEAVSEGPLAAPIVEGDVVHVQYRVLNASGDVVADSGGFGVLATASGSEQDDIMLGAVGPLPPTARGALVGVEPGAQLTADVQGGPHLIRTVRALETRLPLSLRVPSDDVVSEADSGDVLIAGLFDDALLPAQVIEREANATSVRLNVTNDTVVRVYNWTVSVTADSEHVVLRRAPALGDVEGWAGARVVAVDPVTFVVEFEVPGPLRYELDVRATVVQGGRR